MARLLNPFDANQHNPAQSQGMLPIGKHPVKIIDSEVKATKANDGGYLNLILQIIDGPQTGTTGPYRLNLYNSSAQAVEIANNQLSALCHVTGQYQLQDSAQLHNIPFIVEVAPQKNSPEYTEVKRVFDINGNEPGKAAPQQQAPVQQSAAPAWGGGQQEQKPFNPGSYSEKSQPSSMPTMQQQPAQGQAPAWGQANQAQQPAAPAWGGQPVQTEQAPAWGAPQQQQPQGGQPAWGGGQQQAPAWGQR